MRPTSAAARWFSRLRFLAASAGFLLIVATVGLPLQYWTAALSAPWRGGNGGVLIVLGGDIVTPDMIGMSSFWRSVYAVREWRTGHYSRIILTGKAIAPLMKDFLVGQGVPAQRIEVENQAESTRESAVKVAELLNGDSTPRVLLTSDFHMRRALGAFRQAGLQVEPLAIPDSYKRLANWSERWGIFCMLTEETVKMAYYKARGWS
jgi:uncharacterized SAM-binding protein YcdF (DUF218 family)